jgi:anthranilate synthase/aminodeoxychorismate synthase-like glutamine amidotransferase
MVVNLPRKILLVDNKDSFTFNLKALLLQACEVERVQGRKLRPLSQEGPTPPGTSSYEVVVTANDSLLLTSLLTEESTSFSFDNVVIGPGPGVPETSGILIPFLSYLRTHHPNIPLLGVCLGHQAIGEIFGATVTRARRPLHGISSTISHLSGPLFESIPTGFNAMRYHSLIIESSSLPLSLRPEAFSEDGELMSVSSILLPWWGVQFHPESFLTEWGVQLILNYFGAYAI